MKTLKKVITASNTKIFILVLLLVCQQLVIFAQDTTAKKPNSINIEAFGIGLRYSINYERQFQIKESN